MSGITNPVKSTSTSTSLLSGLSRSVTILSVFGFLFSSSHLRVLKVLPESIISSTIMTFFPSMSSSSSFFTVMMPLLFAGLVYLKEEDKAKALKAFKAIKENYPTSSEAQDIDKYIAIAE